MGSGTLVGLAMGLWLSLPAYLSQPSMAAEPGAISQIDPNQARYDQMIAANGVNATPYILAAGYSPAQLAPAPAETTDEPVQIDHFASDDQPAIRPVAFVTSPVETQTSAPAADAERAQPSTPAAADVEPAPQ